MNLADSHGSQSVLKKALARALKWGWLSGLVPISNTFFFSDRLIETTFVPIDLLLFFGVGSLGWWLLETDALKLLSGLWAGGILISVFLGASSVSFSRAFSLAGANWGWGAALLWFCLFGTYAVVLKKRVFSEDTG